MQGGFNGAHNDVACNVLTPVEVIGPRVSPGEYPYAALGAGVPEVHRELVHNINFNDLESVRYVCEQHPVAALITEPILQNIGLVKPAPGYLQGLRDLADEYGFLLVFDEVKTGFRYCVGAYSQLRGVKADLVYFAKALASGYPLSAVGGRREYMDLCADQDAGPAPTAGIRSPWPRRWRPSTSCSRRKARPTVSWSAWADWRRRGSRASSRAADWPRPWCVKARPSASTSWTTRPSTGTIWPCTTISTWTSLSVRR